MKPFNNIQSFTLKFKNMKKRILLWTLLVMAVSSYSFAGNGGGINPKAATSFKKDFANAREAKWETGKSFIKVTFKLNDEVVFAYYGENGDLMAISRNIVPSQLPILQLMELKKSYADYWISDLFEIDSDIETSYDITLENSDSRLILKSHGMGGWEVYKKEIKM